MFSKGQIFYKFNLNFALGFAVLEMCDLACPEESVFSAEMLE